MISSLQPALQPRNGQTLQILIACRVSDPRPGKQDERSLDDQEAEHREWIATHTDLPFEVEVVAGSGSGESLERGEYERLIELVETDQFDLVLTEDVGRIVRRIHAHIFCEHCADHGVRLIALNDNLDTTVPGWEDRSIFSAWHHERSNRDTSERIKRTHRNRFSQGGCLALPVFGYRKPLGAKGDGDVEKDLACEPILKQWFRKLDEGATFAEVSDWLNELGTATGPYCRSDKWTGTMVSRVTRNPILKGIRFRNKRRTRRNNRSGKYRSEKAPPEDLLERAVPHLAYFDADYYDRIVKKVNQRNAKFKRSADPRTDPRRGQPKKRTRFPGQSVHCGVCGRLYVFGGHGQKDHLMCNGAREHKCWNGISFDGDLACERLSQAAFDSIASLPAFEPEFIAMLEAEFAESETARESRLKSIDEDLRKIQRELANIASVLRDAPSSPTLLNELKLLEHKQTELTNDKDRLLTTPAPCLLLPTMDELKDLAATEFSRLAQGSQEFARLMRQIMPSVYVFPVRLIDGGAIQLRAEITFTATPFAPRAASLNCVQEHLTQRILTDLFKPPQRAAFRQQVVALRAEGHTEREAASQLGITHTAAQRAAALQREMDRRGMETPWVSVMEPPDDYRKLRRHRHTRYRFSPLDGFPKPWPV